MANQPEITNMALRCDFENVALGVHAKYAQFDIKKVLERLLLKGSIVVKKAYCDWDCYKEFKATTCLHAHDDECYRSRPTTTTCVGHRGFYNCTSF